MAEPQSKTRTNYFMVNDREKFSDLLCRLVTDEDTQVTMMQHEDMVGFCCHAAVYGVKPIGISDKEAELLKKRLFMDSMDVICDFVGTDVSSWDKDAIDSAMDETIAQMPVEELDSYISRYISSSDEYEVMWDEFVKQIQGLLEPGHACIITSVAWENLRTVMADATVITKEACDILSLGDLALEKAREALNNSEYTTKTTY